MTAETPETTANAGIDIQRLVRSVDFHMRQKYRKGLDEMEIADTPGYWRDRQAQLHPGHQLHGCLGCGEPFKATYTYFDRGRERGRFTSPTRTWQILKANRLPGRPQPAPLNFQTPLSQ